MGLLFRDEFVGLDHALTRFQRDIECYDTPVLADIEFRLMSNLAWLVAFLDHLIDLIQLNMLSVITASTTPETKLKPKFLI